MIPERLKLQPVGDEFVNEMMELCRQIESELESGESAENLLQQWQAFARRKYDPQEFLTFWKSESEETFVLDALHPAPCFDNDLVYAEALGVLDAVICADVPEDQTKYYLRWLEAQFPGSNISDLIYWPDEWFGDTSLFRDEGGAFQHDCSLSSEQILGYAMLKSGRRLFGAPDDVSFSFPWPQ